MFSDCDGHRIPVMRIHLPAADDGWVGHTPPCTRPGINGLLGPMGLSAFPVSRRQGVQIALTGRLPDRSARCGVLAEIEAFGLDFVELRQLPPRLRSPSQLSAAHVDSHQHRLARDLAPPASGR
jgi:hypothetical protein